MKHRINLFFFISLFLIFGLHANSILVSAKGFTNLEDTLLMSLCKKHNLEKQSDWIDIVSKFPKRTIQECKKRYFKLYRKNQKEKRLRLEKIINKQENFRSTLPTKPSFAIRDSVKIILINEENKILLMRTDDKKIKNSSGTYNGMFWQLIGGKIEDGETLEGAAKRELSEETGLTEDNVKFERLVWQSDLHLKMRGVDTFINQYFIVAKTNSSTITMENLTNEEKPVVKSLSWMSLEEIIDCKDVIYPRLLAEYLPDVLSSNYKESVINIDS